MDEAKFMAAFEDQADIKEADYHTRFQDPYYHDPDNPPFRDFNRDIIEPGEEVTVGGKTEIPYPEGAVLVRMDDDFWIAAALPLIEYQSKTIKEIVTELWPDIVAESEFKPDSNDREWWAKYFGHDEK